MSSIRRRRCSAADAVFFSLRKPSLSPTLSPFNLTPSTPSTAQKQVSVWRSRGRLPLGVDATAAFVEAEIE